MMNKNNFINEYIHQIRPYQTVKQVIEMYGRKMDIVRINESELLDDEVFYFRFMRLNYEHSFKKDPMTVNFEFFWVQKNNKSKFYYDFMEKLEHRIIIVIEQSADLVMSNCEALSLDLRIDRGIEDKYVENETIELIEYLSWFHLRKEL